MDPNGRMVWSYALTTSDSRLLENDQEILKIPVHIEELWVREARLPSIFLAQGSMFNSSLVIELITNIHTLSVIISLGDDQIPVFIQNIFQNKECFWC